MSAQLPANAPSPALLAVRLWLHCEHFGRFGHPLYFGAFF